MNKNLKSRPMNKVAEVPTKDQFNYITFAKEYNESISNINPEFSKVQPTNRKMIVKCLTSPSPIQIQLRTNESTNAMTSRLHPEPLIPVGVIVSLDEIGLTGIFQVGDFVQFPINYVMSQDSVNVPNKYILPFPDMGYGYVILDSHAIQCKLTELPKFDYPTVELNDEN